MVCVLTLALLAPNFNRSRDTAKTIACISNMRAILAAAREFFAAGPKAAGPGAAGYMIDLLRKDLVSGGHLKTAPMCPAGGAYKAAAAGTGEVDVACTIHGALETVKEPNVYDRFRMRAADIIFGDEGDNYLHYLLIIALSWVIFEICRMLLNAL